MFFRDLLNGASETLDIRFRSHQRTRMNSADIGEICEIFAQDFLKNYLDDHYRIYRGGNIVNVYAEQSPQMDIILTNRNTLKIFDNKGIYPIESVIGVFSITSNLTIAKLTHDFQQLNKIPKRGYEFNMEKFYGEQFFKQTQALWENAIPFSCIFGFDGDIKEKWIDEINTELNRSKDKSLCPTIIMVNKKGMFEKFLRKTASGEIEHYYQYSSLDLPAKHGYALSKIIYDLYNLSSEQFYRRPEYGNYFKQDY